MAKSDLLVRVGKVLMNKHCRSQRSHLPAAAKDCPYCRVCQHGCTELMHCEKCNKDESWRQRPINRAELEQVLEYLKSCGRGPGYLERRPKNKRFHSWGVALIPLAVKRLRELLKERGA